MTDPFKNIKSQEDCKQYCIKKLKWRDLPEDIVSELFNIAWDYGHSYGYYEVFNIASDLQPLANRIRRYGKHMIRLG